ncbi:MAG: long-chain fatty acid--CoA ligase [Betaproteobacteria bacterium]|nr:MAG: long-chain fatty acid--CoA ligase [Betaproteobacteria bacterium]
MNAATLRGALALHAAARPDAPFLFAPETGRVLTYAELERQALLLGRFLRAMGLRKGDKVGLFLHNAYQTAALFLGSMIGGYVCVPFNLLAQPSQLAYVLAHSDCKILFTARDYEARVAEALPGDNAPEVILVDPDAPELFLLERLPASSPPPLDARDPALLMYTSGTTGTPKGALLTQANLVASARSIAQWHGLEAEDRVLSALPLYHINGQCIVTLSTLYSGGAMVLPHRFSVHEWWALVDRYQVSWINMVPTIIAYLLNAAAGHRKRFPSVRFGRSASAPLPPEQHRAFELTFGIPVIEAMGMTESASTVFANPQDPARRKYGSPGVPCGVEAKVVDFSGRKLSDCEAGEILLRGPSVMLEYYKAPQLTAQAIDRDGWLRSGDLGYRDADGFYFITGRLKELIIKGGENMAPREIDEVLLRHPAVLEAAAVGVPDQNYGQEIFACVVLKPGSRCDEAELRAFCLNELGNFKTPKRIRIIDELPKGPSGKVQRLKLVDLMQDCG